MAYIPAKTGTLDQFRGCDREPRLPGEDSERRTVSINGQPRCLETEQNKLNLYQQTSGGGVGVGGGDRLDRISSAAAKHISSGAVPLVTVLQRTFHLRLPHIIPRLRAVTVTRVLGGLGISSTCVD